MMADTPNPPSGGGHGHSGNILSKEMAGFPVWVWIAIVAAGIGAVYILPKFFGGGTTSATGTSNGTAQGNPGGLGLAIDPTTGLPYAVEGLVPSGGMAGAGGQSVDLTTTNNLLAELLAAQQQNNPPPIIAPGPSGGEHPPQPPKPPIIAPGPSGGVHLAPTGLSSTQQGVIAKWWANAASLSQTQWAGVAQWWANATTLSQSQWQGVYNYIAGRTGNPVIPSASTAQGTAAPSQTSVVSATTVVNPANYFSAPQQQTIAQWWAHSNTLTPTQWASVAQWWNKKPALQAQQWNGVYNYVLAQRNGRTA